MVVCYRIKVHQLQILMKHISPEMQRAKNKIIFCVHNAELCMKNVDISRRRERQFYLDMFPAEVNLLKESMTVTAYKVHSTGTLITLGTTCEDITEYVYNAIGEEGLFATIPGIFYLRNASGKCVAKLQCDIQLMAKTDRLPDHSDFKSPQCEVMTIGHLPKLRIQNPFLSFHPLSDLSDSEVEEINEEDKI